MRIGIDMDDVISNFQKKFVEILNTLYGKPALDQRPCDWEFSNSGCSAEEIKAAWKYTEGIENFWATIEPLPSFDTETQRLLHTALYYHDVFFVTNRYPTKGTTPLKQTKMALYKYALIHTPNVLIAKDKGPMATVLELDTLIDDRPKNVLDVLAARPNARVYLADSSHNQTFSDPRIPRVKDLKEYLKLILEAN